METFRNGGENTGNSNRTRKSINPSKSLRLRSIKKFGRKVSSASSSSSSSTSSASSNSSNTSSSTSSVPHCQFEDSCSSISSETSSNVTYTADLKKCSQPQRSSPSSSLVGTDNERLPSISSKLSKNGVTDASSGNSSQPNSNLLAGSPVSSHLPQSSTDRCSRSQSGLSLSRQESFSSSLISIPSSNSSKFLSDPETSLHASYPSTCSVNTISSPVTSTSASTSTSTFTQLPHSQSYTQISTLSNEGNSSMNIHNDSKVKLTTKSFYQSQPIAHSHSASSVSSKHPLQDHQSNTSFPPRILAMEHPKVSSFKRSLLFTARGIRHQKSRSKPNQPVFPSVIPHTHSNAISYPFSPNPSSMSSTSNLHSNQNSKNFSEFDAGRLQQDIFQRMLNSNGTLPETNLRYCIDNGYWISGTGVIRQDSQLQLSEKNIGVKCILDVRASKVSAHMNKVIIDISSSSKEIETVSLLFDTKETDIFRNWIAVLFLHSNLKQAGLESKLYLPESNVERSEDILLKGNVHVYAPFLNLPPPEESSLPDSQLASSHHEREKYTPFTPTNWVKVTTIIRKNGLLELQNFEGIILHQINIKNIFASGVLRLDFSVFYLANVLYIGNPTTNSYTNFTGQEETRPCDLIKHTETSSCRNDSALYLKFGNKEDFGNWYRALKRLARLQVYAPSTANPKKSIRISRKLNIRVLEAKMNYPSELSKEQFPELYVEICCANRIWGRTSISKPTKFPFWREDFEVSGLSNHTIPKFFIHLHSRSQDDPKGDKLVGTVILDHTDLKASEDVEKWHKFDTENGQGSICLKIHMDEVMVAPREYYDDIRRELKSLSCTDLTLMVRSEDEAQRSDLNSISRLFLNMALATSSSELAISWMSALITQEINKIHDFIIEKHGHTCFNDRCSKKQLEFKNNMNNTLFRGNSVLTKSLERFMRLVGNDHLEKTVGTFVRKFVDNCPELEIDPSRIKSSDSVVTEDVVKANQDLMLDVALQIWNLIRTSVDDMPLSFKIIFRHLSSELRIKLHQSSSSVYNYVAGFLFLRFFCPGLLNPKLFGLTKFNQVVHAQRSLTLVTKLLMGFANRTRFGLKEPWMIPMNAFIDQHEDELMNYFKNVTLEGKNDSEITLLISAEGHVSGIDKINAHIPLCELMNNEFMIDRDANYAHLINIWKKLLKPNKEEFFASLKNGSAEKTIGTKTHGELKDSPESPKMDIPGVFTNSRKASSHSEDECVEIRYKRLYAACESCYNSVNQIVADLSESPETFDASLVNSYTKHISFSWANDTKTLSFIPGIKPDLDWYDYAKAETVTHKENQKEKDELFIRQPRVIIKKRPLSQKEGLVTEYTDFILDSPQQRRNSLPALNTLAKQFSDSLAIGAFSPIGIQSKMSVPDAPSTIAAAELAAAPRIYLQPNHDDLLLRGQSSNSFFSCPKTGDITHCDTTFNTVRPTDRAISPQSLTSFESAPPLIHGSGHTFPFASSSTRPHLPKWLKYWP